MHAMRCGPQRSAMSLLMGALFALLTLPAVAQETFRPARQNGIDNQYIVVLRERPAAAPETGRDLARRFGGTIQREWEHALSGFLVRMPAPTARSWAADPRVAFVEQDFRFSAFSAPIADCASISPSVLPMSSDRTFPGSPQSIDCPQPDPQEPAGVCVDNWGLDRIDQREPRSDDPADSAYTFSLTGSGVKVYVIDGGVFAAHNELEDRFTGLPRVLAGYDATHSGGTGDCFSHGHGTHVAALIAGHTTGVAKDARIVPVKYTDCVSTDANSLASWLISALDWVAGNHASGEPAVANLSSNVAAWRASEAIRQAVVGLTQDGVLLVQSAGNQNDVGGNACTFSLVHREITDGVLVVGGMDENDGRWLRDAGDPNAAQLCGVQKDCGSNSGRCVDLWAPAAHIVSASREATNGYCRLSGTSMAAPHAAGVAALLLQSYWNGATRTPTPGAIEAALIDASTRDRLSAAIGSSPNRIVSTLFPASGPPVAGEDRFLLEGDQPLVIPYATLLANDFDWDRQPLTVTAVSDPRHGTLIFGANAVTYDPGTYDGDESFTYTVSDGTHTTAGTITTLQTLPIVVDDHVGAWTGSYTPVHTFELANNDFDPDGPTVEGDAEVSFVRFTTPLPLPAHLGTFTQHGSTEWRYNTPSPSFNGIVELTYEITDQEMHTRTGKLFITGFSGLGASPSANPDRTETRQDVAVTVAVKANDNPATAVVTAVTDPAHGTAVLNADGTVTYTPDPGYAGFDSFTYALRATSGTLSGGSVVVEILPSAATGPNRDPEPEDDSVTARLDTPLVIAVLDNDDDPDGHVLTVIAVGDPNAIINPDGTITFTPPAGFLGDYPSFSYTVADGHGGEASADVFITVLPPAQPPVLQTETFQTPQRIDLPITCAQLLANDSDPQGGPLTVTALGAPSSGTFVSCTNICDCTYRPASGFANDPNPATFSYTVRNSANLSASMVDTINVTNVPPVAGDDSATVRQGSSVLIPVLANDADPGGDPLTLKSVTPPPSGTAVIEGNAIRYTPGNLGGQPFRYVVGDTHGGEDEADVSVTVQPPNATPDARGNQLAAPYGLLFTIHRATLLANDYDPDGDALTISAFNTAGLAGTLSCPAGGTSCSYTPPSGFVGVTSYSYTVSDGKGGTDTATVRLKVGTPQSPPVAADDLLVTTRNTAGPFSMFNLLANDTDADGDVLDAAVVSGPRDYGAVACSTPPYHCTYTPNAGFVGIDRFSYTVTDGITQASAFVRMLVQPPWAPTFDAREDQLGTPQNQARFFTRALLTANDYNPAGGALTITGYDTAGLNGTLDCASDPNGCLYQPGSFFTGVTRFKYTVSNAQGHSDTAIVRIKVGQGNAAPVAANDSLVTRSNTPRRFSVFDLLKNDVDAENDPLTVTVYPNASQGTVACSSPSYWCTYTPPANYTGTATFTYVVSDGIAYSNQATVTVTVQPAAAKDALLLTQSVPASLRAGQTVAVSLTLKNVGTQSWNLTGAQCNAFRLGAVNPYDNTTWGAARAELPSTVPPGGEVTIGFSITAPLTPGLYNFQRRMVHECVEWFGDLTPNVVVAVNP